MASEIETIRDDRATGGRRVRIAAILTHDQELQDRKALMRLGFGIAEARKIAKLKAARQARAQGEGETAE